MDWSKVIANLREQTSFYAKRANELGQQSGNYELVKQYRNSADVASILASALSAGLDKSPEKSDVRNTQSQITP
jgi:hypothetical protein